MRKYKIIEKVFLSKDAFKIRVERPDTKIIAGQCFNVGVPGVGINREYSMYSGAEEDFLEFLIRRVDGGLVSQQIAKLSHGDYLEIDGPYGQFAINPLNLNKKHMFICTGTGVAPFHSFIKSYPNLDYLIVHGVREEGEQYDKSDYLEGNYVSCISSKKSRVTDFVKNNIPKSETEIYICGNRNMIVDVVQILLENNISGDQIVTEVFF